VFCNKVIAGSTSEEWLETLCDNVLRKDISNEMLRRDDVIENVL
jgi:hypothetical protein